MHRSSRTGRAAEYNEKPQLHVSYYTYWSGLPMSGRFETTLRPGLGYAARPRTTT